MAQQAMTREPITPAKLLGFEVEIDPAAGQAHCLPEVDDRHINRHNALQGGIVATLLDVVAGVTASLAHDPQGLRRFGGLSHHQLCRPVGLVRFVRLARGGGASMSVKVRMRSRLGVSRSDCNAARRNALSPEYYQGLVAGLAKANESPDIAAVILAGEGGFFCAGGDLNSLRERRDLSETERRAQIDKLNAVIRAIRHCRKPVIAAVEGGAAGRGFRSRWRVTWLWRRMWRCLHWLMCAPGWCRMGRRPTR